MESGNKSINFTLIHTRKVKLWPLHKTLFGNNDHKLFVNLLESFEKHLSIHPSTPLSIHPSIQPGSQSSPSIYPFIHTSSISLFSFIHSFIHQCIHPFITPASIDENCFSNISWHGQGSSSMCCSWSSSFQAAIIIIIFKSLSIPDRFICSIS